MLELKNISLCYGKKTVLDGITACFEKGKLTSIIGVNGCGKTTLLRSALGMLPLARGEITLDGRDLRSMSRNEIARKLAYLPQGKSTPDMTVEKMVLHGRFPYLSYPRRYSGSDRELARAAMQTVGITDLAHEPLSTLSGGMRQNAYIAMALAQDTDYILLDEPTTYLDISHQLDLMKLLRTLTSDGKGIVTVMHDLPMALKFSDELLVMDNGKVMMQAKPSEICNTSIIKDVFDVRIESLGDGRYCYSSSDVASR
ncbi:MAG: ABC transporter ATP-binding protein [Ruminococcaceae bacterium]|nr:ABC transporter ATP-binding protein [Oscillospiraceae bacterium]